MRCLVGSARNPMAAVLQSVGGPPEVHPAVNCTRLCKGCDTVFGNVKSAPLHAGALRHAGAGGVE